MSAFLAVVIAGLAARFTAMNGSESQLNRDDSQMLHDALLARAVLAEVNHDGRSVAQIVALANKTMPDAQATHRQPFELTHARATAGEALAFLDACDRVITYQRFNGAERNFDLIIENPLEPWEGHAALSHLKSSRVA